MALVHTDGTLGNNKKTTLSADLRQNLLSSFQHIQHAADHGLGILMPKTMKRKNSVWDEVSEVAIHFRKAVSGIISSLGSLPFYAFIAALRNPLTAFKCAAVLFMAFAVVDDVFNMGLTVQALETVSRPIGGVFVDVMNMGGETIINAALDFSNAVFGTDFGDFHTESNYYLTADGLFDTQEGSFGLKLATDRPELVGNDIHMARNDIAGVDFNNGVISANYTPYEDRLPVTAHNQKILNVT